MLYLRRFSLVNGVACFTCAGLAQPRASLVLMQYSRCVASVAVYLLYCITTTCFSGSVAVYPLNSPYAAKPLR